MKAAFATSALFLLAAPALSPAQDAVHRMSEHPAVLVKRQQATATYDYAARFYPHPAWLYLETDRHEMGDHPAVIVARRAAAEAQATAAAAAQAAAGTPVGLAAPTSAVR